MPELNQNVFGNRLSWAVTNGIRLDICTQAPEPDLTAAQVE